PREGGRSTHRTAAERRHPRRDAASQVLACVRTTSRGTISVLNLVPHFSSLGAGRLLRSRFALSPRQWPWEGNQVSLVATDAASPSTRGDRRPIILASHALGKGR